MQSRIHNVFLYDYLKGLGDANPSYFLDVDSNYIIINNICKPMLLSYKCSSISVPMLDIGEEWKNTSWASLPIPLKIKTSLDAAIVYGASICPNKFESKSFDDAIEIAKKFYTEKEMTLSYAYYSFLASEDNYKSLANNVLFRRNINVKELPGDVVVFSPDQEFFGLFAQSEDFKKFGMFFILNNLVVVRLEK